MCVKARYGRNTTPPPLLELVPSDVDIRNISPLLAVCLHALPVLAAIMWKRNWKQSVLVQPFWCALLWPIFDWFEAWFEHLIECQDFYVLGWRLGAADEKLEMVGLSVRSWKWPCLTVCLPILPLCMLPMPPI